MATMNPFDLLGDDDAEDPSQLLAAQKVAPPKKSTAPASVAPPANKQPAPARLPSKPLPPAQAVREARREGGRGGGRGGGGRGYGRGRRGYGRDSAPDENSRSPTGGQGSHEDGDAKRQAERHGYGGPQGGYRGGRHGGFTNGEVGDEERPHRSFDQHSGIGRGNEIKREGAGHINWGTQNDQFAQVNKEVVVEGEKNLGGKVVEEETAADGSKDATATESEEKEPEDKEMTLEEYEKVLEEKRKALQALKTEERKVDAKVFESMQQLSSKKDNDDVFIKLGSEKDKRKETLEKDEKAKKSVSINEFLKPAEGEKYYSPGGGRGRGRGRGRGAWGLGGRDAMSSMMAPAIEDPGQFPTLGGK